MGSKKFIFILSSAEKNPLEALGLMRIATNMKAFDDSVVIDFFLIGEAVRLAKKGVAETLTVEMDGQTVSVGDLFKTLTEDFGAKFFVCPAFMPAYGMTKDDLIAAAELKPSSHLGEMLLEGRVPFSLTF
jgi:predicted peroxiredoxin